jgi:hypothetical protein
VFGTFFDRLKDVAIAAVIAGFLAIGGMLALTAAAAWQLSAWMTWPAALAVTGVGILAIAAITLWVGTLKKKPEQHHQESSDSDIDPVGLVLGLMELPVEVTKKIVSEKPIASIVVLSSLGLLIARKPEVALKLFDKVVGGLGGGLGGASKD